jgi:excinuclease ABC subunit A
MMRITYMQDKIIIKGAREHNLKNISLELPRNKMIVFTGLSGSGKSSLAFDTIFAEGQRRYIESLSAYARQFLGGMQKPDVDEIEGLSPAISIDQKAHSANPRSTVATITEIYDYLRVLFARVGKPYCPICGTKIEKMTIDQMMEQIVKKVFPPKADQPRAEKHENSKAKKNTKSEEKELKILSPVVRGRKGEYYQMLYDMYNAGYLEVRVDGVMKSLRERIVLSKNNKHTIEIVTDKIPLVKDVDKDIEQRLYEAVNAAVDLSNGLCTVMYPNGEEQLYSTEYSCPNDGFSFPEIEPRLFSFNSPYGYCEACTGLGTKELFSTEICPVCEGKRLNKTALSVKVGEKNIWEVTNLTISEAREFFAALDMELSETDREISGAVFREISSRLQFMFNVGLHYLTLSRKAGTLSGGEAQRIRLASQVGTKLVGALYVLDEPTIGLHQRDNDQLVKTLRNLCDVGNTIIVVEHDEDTILVSDWIVDIGPGAGKHGGQVSYSGPLDQLLAAKSTKATNSKPQVPHKSQITNSKPSKVFDCDVLGDPKTSITGQYLRGEKKVVVPETRRKVDSATPKIKIKGATEHNLKNISVEIPLRRFVCLTGVSGSGKSTLMHDILHQSLMNRFFRTDRPVGAHKEIIGTEYLDSMITIDQAAIGRTSRSNPATYTKAFDHIRELFAETPEAKIRGFKIGKFSFNVPGGRCENCEGKGVLEIEMHFLPSVEIICDVCRGKRFTNEVLQVFYKEKNIADVLNMTIEEAEEFFKDIPMINDKLKILNQVGLAYLTLGQSATTLSGGEAQRIKLSKELAKHGTSKTLYLLDEPTTGLHYEDVRKLIDVLQRLVSQGNTVMVIEHNLDVIKSADWLIDLGPEGGDKGGEVIATGTPEAVAQNPRSFTGQYLKRLL